MRKFCPLVKRKCVGYDCIAYSDGYVAFNEWIKADYCFHFESRIDKDREITGK